MLPNYPKPFARKYSDSVTRGSIFDYPREIIAILSFKILLPLSNAQDSDYPKTLSSGTLVIIYNL